MIAVTLSADARQVLLALRALRAATLGAVAVASGLSLELVAAALDELAVAGEARCTPEGTWLAVGGDPGTARS